MIVFPNAKINIGLNILRRRPDGYHDLETVMYPVPWHDVLEAVPSASGHDTLVCTGRPVDCPPEKNLVMKAVKALRETVDFPPVDLFLEKIIPDGAGLGGGSADAAFAIRAVDALFSLGLPKRIMAEVAARVGADCPFFIYNEPAVCTGTGTDIAAIPMRFTAGTWIAIVKPDVSVSTKEAYAGVTPCGDVASLTDTVGTLPPEQWQGRVRNGFENSIFPRHPEIAAVKEELLNQGAVYASMSGSGAAVYGIFLNKESFKPLPEWNCYLFEKLGK